MKTIKTLTSVTLPLALCAVAAPAVVPTFAASARPLAFSTADSQARHIVAIARHVMADDHLKSVIISVRKGDEDLVTTALGDSMTGVPATTQMHFRSGAVAISYLSTVLLELVDQRVVTLGARLSRWLPKLPHARDITLGMLAASRSGYRDYVTNKHFEKASAANVFRAWRRQDLIRIGTSQPLLFRPGKGWGYSHTGFVVLGQALEKITGKPVAQLVRDGVLQPLGLHNTRANCTAEIPQPVLHAFTSDRGVYEDSTYWDPSWSLGCGLVETSNISDMIKTAVAVGTGSLLSKRAHRLQIEPRSRITPPSGPPVFYGLGIFTGNGWLFQNPLFSGYQAIMGDLPSKKIAIAVATTVSPDASADTNYSTAIFQKVGAYLSPEQPPPPS